MSDDRAGRQTRHYGLDWLRIGAFGLLILYHIGMFFVPWSWHVKNDVLVQGFAYPMLAAQTWRLSLLFVVSGFASWMLLGKLGGGPFLRSRSLRLLVPLLFGMAVVVPPQVWVELSARHDQTIAPLAFYPRMYFSFGTLNGIDMPTWNHLWFVAYLWAYSAGVALALAVLPPRARTGLQDAFTAGLSGWLVLVVPIVYLLLVRLVIAPGQGESHGLFDDLPGHLVYLFAFLFGLGLGGTPELWTGIRRHAWLARALALAALAALFVAETAYPGENAIMPPNLRAGLTAARVVTAWCTIVALLAFADRVLDRDHPLRQPLAEAVFPAYLVHQTVIVLAGWALLRWPLWWPARLVVLIVVTASACALVYLIGRRIDWLRPLIGLQRRGAVRLGERSAA